MNEMQQQSQGIKAGEVSIRRYNIWLYLSCCPQNKQTKKQNRKVKKGKKDEKAKHTFGLICVHTSLMI